MKRPKSSDRSATPAFWIGTSGYQYREWKGTFYPETLSTAKMLAYYAERFPTTEINYSFRRVPSEKSLQTWRDGTPERFRFSLKAPQKITHFAKLRDCGETVAFFAARIAELSPKLGAVLFQLPPTLKADVALLSDFLATLPPAMRAAFEFRHASWFQDATFAALGARNAALCVADSEDLSTPAVRTADFAYFRLRREDYRPKDLARWAGTVCQHAGKAADAYVYFKHEESGIGPKFAASFMKRLTSAKALR
jgi:uncharacterized protein YecE (DUF72 family)